MKSLLETQPNSGTTHETRIEPIESLRFEGASFSYDGNKNVFDQLTFDMPLNANIFVTGPLGSGASTLLRLLSVLIQPHEGQFLVNGKDTSQMSFDEFLPLRKSIGYSFDLGGLLSNRTIAENWMLPLIYHNLCSYNEAERRVDELASEFGVGAQLHQRPAEVSGGLRKLCCVLRAFIIQPSMVVMDDPFTGLGMESSRRLVRLVQELREAKQLKHVFLTSRDEVWPHWIGCDALNVDHGVLRFEERKAA